MVNRGRDINSPDSFSLELLTAHYFLISNSTSPTEIYSNYYSNSQRVFTSLVWFHFLNNVFLNIFQNIPSKIDFSTFTFFNRRVRFCEIWRQIGIEVAGEVLSGGRIDTHSLRGFRAAALSSNSLF